MALGVSGAAPRVTGALRAACVAVAAGSLLVVIAGVWLSPQRVHHDAALYLTAGDLLLRGAVPYVDFFELNPPLIMYLSALPVALARALGADPIPVFSLSVVALTGASAGSLFAQLRRAGEASAGAALGALWCVYGWYAWTRLDFGQREHLFGLLFLPFLVLRWRRVSGLDVGRAESVTLGVAAALGACIKPHFLVAALAVELALLASARRPRRHLSLDALAFVATGIAYGAHFLLLPAAARESLFGRWVPLIARGYGAYNAPLSRLVNDSFRACVAVAVVGVVASLVAPGPRAALLRALVGFCVASAASYLVQHKGFQHRIPLQMGAVALASVVAAELDARLPRAPLALLALVGCGGAFGAYEASEVERRGPYWRVVDRPFVERIRARTRPGDRVLFVATTVDPAAPVLLQSGRLPGSRYLWAFPIAMLYANAPRDVQGRVAYRSDAQRPPSERRFLRELSEDVARLRPALIFVATSAPWPWTFGCPPGFNLSHYLRATGFTDTALRGYRPVGEALGFVEWERVPP